MELTTAIIFGKISIFIGLCFVFSPLFICLYICYRRGRKEIELQEKKYKEIQLNFEESRRRLSNLKDLE